MEQRKLVNNPDRLVRLTELYRERSQAAADLLAAASISIESFKEAEDRFRHLTKCINELLLSQNVITNIEDDF